MKLVLGNNSRNNFVTGLIYNKIYNDSVKLIVERILPFFAASIFRAGRFLSSVLFAARQNVGFFHDKPGAGTQKVPVTFANANPKKVPVTFLVKYGLGGFCPAIKRLSNVPLIVLVGVCYGGAAENINARLKEAEKRLSSASPAVRRSALADVASLKGRKAVPQLLKALGDRDPSVRGDAAASLGRLKSGEAVAPLVNLLKNDVRAQVRGQVALAMADIGDSRAVPALVGCFKDKAAGVRGNCIRALGILKAKEAVAPLAGLMDGANADLKAQALGALGQVGTQEAAGAVKKELEDLRAKRAGGAQQDQPLLVEEEAIRALGKTGGADAVPLVKKGLDSPDDRIKAVSCRALMQLGDKSELPVCLRLLSNSEAGVRREMAEALLAAWDPSAAGAVREALPKETNPVVRRMLESLPTER